MQRLRSAVNYYAVNRGLLFGRGAGANEREKWSRERDGGRSFMEREMIYGPIVENNSRGSKDV